MDDPPTRQEVQSVIAGLKNNKAVGPDNLPAEVLKYGGEAVLECLCRMFIAVWNAGCAPQQCKDADVISIYKKKGDRVVCGNSRSISLLTTAGKVLAHVVLMRLLQCIADDVLPESQCGFRRERSTVDMVFVARQLEEKCHEHYKDLFMFFLDLAKAFDSVPRPMELQKMGCQPRYLAVLRSLHDGASARVEHMSEKFESFPVDAGVKQGCVLAPVFFNPLLPEFFLS